MGEGTRYAKRLQDLAADHPFSIIRSQLAPGATVLDLGCGSGDVGAYIAEAGVVVDGVEPELERAEVARARLRRVLVGNIGETNDGLDPHYTAALLIDVLEHIADPVPALQWAAHRADITFVFMPNAAHYSARRKLLKGDWTYRETGIFDRDHLRFYNLATMREMVERAELTVDRMWPTMTALRWVPKRFAACHPNLFANAALLRIV